MKRQKKRLKMSKFEKLIYLVAFVLVVMMPISIIFSQATLSKINIEVEKISRKVNYQIKKNESISMKINELASLDKIQQVAKEYGLSYNSNNIKSIEESR